jgi:hypothetical protein
VKLTWKTILNPFHTLFTPGRIEICVNTTNANSLDGISIEVIGGCAVPLAVGSGDSGDEAGGNGVGAGHQGRSGVNRILVRTSCEDGGDKKEDKKKGR